MARAKRRDYFVCPHCGAEVPSGARACPECGSDERTGWSQDADLWHGGGDEFDYDDFVRREFGGRPRRLLGLPWWAALALTAALAVGLLFIVW
jgi:hypothetical protein